MSGCLPRVKLITRFQREGFISMRQKFYIGFILSVFFMSASLPADPVDEQLDHVRDLVDAEISRWEDRHPEFAKLLKNIIERKWEESAITPARKEEILLLVQPFTNLSFEEPGDLFRALDQIREAIFSAKEKSNENHSLLVGLYFEFLNVLFEDDYAESFSKDSIASHPETRTLGLSFDQMLEVLHLDIIQGVPIHFELGAVKDLESTFQAPLFHPGRIRELYLPVFVDALQSAKSANEFLKFLNLIPALSEKWATLKAFAVRSSLSSLPALRPTAEEAREILRVGLNSEATSDDYDIVRRELVLSLQRSSRFQHQRMAELIESFDGDSEALYFLSLVIVRTEFESVEDLIAFYRDDVQTVFQRYGNSLPPESLALAIMHWLAATAELEGGDLSTVESQGILSAPYSLFRSWESVQPDDVEIDQFLEFRSNGMRSRYNVLAREGMEAAQTADRLAQYARFAVVPTSEFVALKMDLLIHYVPKLVRLSSQNFIWTQYLTAVPGLDENKLISIYQEIEKIEASALVKFALLLKAFQETKLASTEEAQTSEEAERIAKAEQEFEIVKANVFRLGQEIVLENFANSYRVASEDERVVIEEKVFPVLASRYVSRIQYRQRQQTFRYRPGFCVRALKSLQKILPGQKPGRISARNKIY